MKLNTKDKVIIAIQALMYWLKINVRTIPQRLLGLCDSWFIKAIVFIVLAVLIAKELHI